jgi:hypothetical protein
MSRCLSRDERVVEFQSGSVDLRLSPVAVVGNERIVELALFSEFQAKVGRYSWLVPAGIRVSRDDG